MFFLTFAGYFYSQPKQIIKSLNENIDNAKNDTDRVLAFANASAFYSTSNFEKSLHYAHQALFLSKKMNYTKGIVNSLNKIADAYWYNNDYQNSQIYYFKSYKISDSINYKKGVAYSMYNIGWTYCIQQLNFSEDHYLYKAAQIFREINDTTGLLQASNALGNYYTERYRYSKKEAFLDSSLKYFNQGLDLCSEKDRDNSKAPFYGNLAILMTLSGKYEAAIVYADKSLEVHLAERDSSAYIEALNYKAISLSRLNKIDEAFELFTTTYNYSCNHNLHSQLPDALRGIAYCYEKKGDKDNALKFYKNYISYKDSTIILTTVSSINTLKTNFELGKKENDIKDLKHANEIQELKNQKNSYLLFAAVVVVIIILIIAYLLYKQNRQKNIANTLLQEQNKIIKDKKQEIEDSIEYAKGIQMALLSSQEDLKKQIPNSFIYYQPKDVVSGDFYWFHQVDDSFYCAVADCTGHGVPGALMSIVSIDKINKAVFEKKLKEPSEILQFLNIEIKNALKQDNYDSKQKDGFDIALLRFNKTLNKVVYAGANRPLYLVRDKVTFEYKPDKVSVGGFTPSDFQYKQLQIDLQKDDCLYMCTDGYADQFGGTSGKKFMTKNFKLFLELISSEDINTQQTQIKGNYDLWKGSYEQVDDVLVIGIKI